MRGLLSALSILLVACGGNGGGQDDTSTDTPQDTIDTQGDTSPDTIPDTVEDTVLDTFADTPADTPIDEAVEEEAPECTLDDDCGNGVFCDGEETCSAEGTCQAGTLVTCDDTNPCTTDRCNEDNECTFDPTDSDGDGYATETGPGGETCTGTDCDDTNNAIFPGALPIACSDVDNDCNGNPDSDNDGDGHMDITCAGGEDCNDVDAGVWDGAWYDPTTGYMWESPPLAGHMSWDIAVSHCSGLSLCGYAAGEWRLPTINELRSLIRGCPGTASGGACGATDLCLDYDACNVDCGGCSSLGGPGTGGCYWDPSLEGDCSSIAYWAYWSSSSWSTGSVPLLCEYAWSVLFSSATVTVTNRVGEWYCMNSDQSSIRCIRSIP